MATPVRRPRYPTAAHVVNLRAAAENAALAHDTARVEAEYSQLNEQALARLEATRLESEAADRAYLEAKADFDTMYRLQQLRRRAVALRDQLQALVDDILVEYPKAESPEGDIFAEDDGAIDHANSAVAELDDLISDLYRD